MDDDKQLRNEMAGWAPNSALVIALGFLLLGIAAGYLSRDLLNHRATNYSANAPAPIGTSVSKSQAQPMNADISSRQIVSQKLQQALAQQLPPLLKRLKTNPDDAKLLADIGNMYFDARLYRDAAAYYARSLQIEPRNTSVRTDLGNAYWFSGNTDEAIAEFKGALKIEPHKATTLFNLGVAQWQGKMDAKAALDTWKELLDTNPNFNGKEIVIRMMTQAKRHAGVDPQTKAYKPAM